MSENDKENIENKEFEFIKGPIKVPGFRGFPTVNSLVLLTSFEMNFDFMLLCTYIREHALHFCPEYENAALTTPSAALSKSAVWVTIAAFFPPSSAITGLGLNSLVFLTNS